MSEVSQVTTRITYNIDPAYVEDVVELHYVKSVPKAEADEMGVPAFIQKYVVDEKYDIQLSADGTQYDMYEFFKIKEVT